MEEDAIDMRLYQTSTGTEPVRDWLRSLPLADRKATGEDIRSVQIG